MSSVFFVLCSLDLDVLRVQRIVAYLNYPQIIEVRIRSRGLSCRFSLFTFQGWRYIQHFGYLMELTLSITMLVFLVPQNCASCFGAGAIAASMAWFSLIFRLSE